MSIFKARCAFPALMIWVLLLQTVASADPDRYIGRHLFQSYCVICHGTDGKGGGPLMVRRKSQAADLTRPYYQQMELPKLVKTIGKYSQKDDKNRFRKKRAQSIMPKWSTLLPKRKLQDIAAFIPMLTDKDLLKRGDVYLGGKIFSRSCESCHGVEGKGDGALAKHLRLNMVDLTDSGSIHMRLDEKVLSIIRQGNPEPETYMPAWQGVLSDDDILNVAAFVKSLRR